MPATLSELRERAKTRADMSSTDFLSDSEWDTLINKAADRLYARLVVAFEDYYLTEMGATLSGSTYSLPDNFFKLLGIDVRSGGKWYPLSTYQWTDRNTLRNASGLQAQDVRYRLRNKELHFLPDLPANTSVLISYIPTREPLVDGSDEANFPLAWDEYVVLTAAIAALAKEESDTSDLRADLARLEKEMEEEIGNRSPGEVARVEDVYADEEVPPRCRE